MYSPHFLPISGREEQYNFLKPHWKVQVESAALSTNLISMLVRSAKGQGSMKMCAIWVYHCLTTWEGAGRSSNSSSEGSERKHFQACQISLTRRSPPQRQKTGKGWKSGGDGETVRWSRLAPKKKKKLEVHFEDCLLELNWTFQEENFSRDKFCWVHQNKINN